ncbi:MULTISPECIES: hypothetical protein [Klebsiella/Raoultella group]|jgi:hypothetical protein|uniref:hypothetical protein n=1 Tax=Klebsiella/Raoultella group TaxID=2890311 RepID=UPI000516E450|nr:MULTISPECIES: hypothetical protein [Klebsiella/Raoultella group]MDM4166678.1 hypothetical protein [Klebsiella michiganensis]EKR9385285.1 hypothetical protein [Raoultella ornithinolytica]ELI8946549.1 hypothetical protein [Klebsiella oxytoca]KAB8133741.1 hypothetical protein FNH10_12875 [Raoultella ornithinolytica]MBK0624137.1 hypothetical protein [Klebsiella aerogenes]
MSVTSIKLENKISDPEFVEISANARKRERAHLLGLLRIFVGQLKKESLTPEEIYSSVERWISHRELPISED